MLPSVLTTGRSPQRDGWFAAASIPCNMGGTHECLFQNRRLNAARKGSWHWNLAIYAVKLLQQSQLLVCDNSPDQFLGMVGKLDRPGSAPYE